MTLFLYDQTKFTNLEHKSTAWTKFMGGQEGHVSPNFWTGTT